MTHLVVHDQVSDSANQTNIEQSFIISMKYESSNKLIYGLVPINEYLCLTDGVMRRKKSAKRFEKLTFFISEVLCTK